jgi:hypothetical protein
VCCMNPAPFPFAVSSVRFWILDVRTSTPPPPHRRSQPSSALLFPSSHLLSPLLSFPSLPFHLLQYHAPPHFSLFQIFFFSLSSKLSLLFSSSPLPLALPLPLPLPLAPPPPTSYPRIPCPPTPSSRPFHPHFPSYQHLRRIPSQTQLRAATHQYGDWKLAVVNLVSREGTEIEYMSDIPASRKVKMNLV